MINWTTNTQNTIDNSQSTIRIPIPYKPVVKLPLPYLLSCYRPMPMQMQ